MRHTPRGTRGVRIRRRFALTLATAALLAMASSPRAAAQPTATQPASILIFPLVVNDSGRDTVIALTNTGNTLVTAHCVYVNGALTDPLLPPGPSNPQLCSALEFDIELTRQQPTYWVVSQGRPDAPADAQAGYDPGPVPAVANGFTGFLACIQTDAAGTPFSGNHLVGAATLHRRTGGDFAKYAAVGLRGTELNDGDNVLDLGGAPFSEYDGCPQTIIVEQLADGAEDPVAGSGSSVTTELALVPCSFDLDALTFPSSSLQITVHNEFESVLSTSTSTGCWSAQPLVAISPILNAVSIGSPFIQTRITPSGSSPAGIVAVSSALRTGAGVTPPTASEAANAGVIGERTEGDQIVLSPSF